MILSGELQPLIVKQIPENYNSSPVNSSVGVSFTPQANSDLVLTMLRVCTERISVLDKNLTFLGASPSVLRAWNITETELLHTTLPQLIGLQCYQDNVEKSFHRVLGGKPETVEFMHISAGANSTARLVEYNLSPFFTDSGKNAGVVLRAVDLTEQRQVENNLLAAQQRLTDFADATSDWHWEMDAQLKFTWLSKAYHDFYGVDPQKMYGQHRTPVLQTDEENKAWINHCHLLHTHQPFRDFEFRISTPGGIRWSRTSGVPTFNNGVFSGYRGTASDITRLKEAENNARRAESRFMHAIDEFPGSFALFDENESLVVYNKRYTQLHTELGDELKPGLTYERYLRVLIENDQIPEASGGEEDWLNQRLARFRNPQGPTELQKHDNTWYRVSEQRLPDGGCLKTMLDITDLKKAELAIKEERNLLRSLIDSIPHMIYAKNRELEFTVINKAAADFMGQSTSLGYDAPTQVADYITTALPARIVQLDRQVIDENKEVKNLEHIIERQSDGKETWVSTCKSPLYDTNGKNIGLVGATSDISVSKKIETDLIRSESRFRDFAETAADWFWEMNVKREICYLSERYSDITGANASDLIFKDYLTVAEILIHDADSKEKFIHCIKHALAFSDLEATIVTATGDTRYFFISGKPWFDENNIFSGIRGAGRDVTNFRDLESQLSYQASHDELTGLPNRREFMARLDQLVSLSKQNKCAAVLGYLDLDQFKVINDTAGHRAGDQLLIQVSQQLKGSIRNTDTLARLGGDEFGILLRDTSFAEAENTMRRIIAQLEEIRFPWDDNIFSIGGSVGLVAIDGSNNGSTELLSKADLACYSAKDAGRGRINFYNAENDEIINRRSQLLVAAGITDAIERDRFVLHAQPIHPINQNQQSTVHYEILVRMLDDDDQLIYPGAFIPAAERFDLMVRIDRWVISRSLKQMKQVFNDCCACGITINLSGQSLSDQTLADYVQEQLELNAIAPSRVCFEITETAAISNFKSAQTFIETLKYIGCSFALDDFGSGLSSFGYLKLFKVDYLKIDGCFVRDIVNDPTDKVMVTSINQVGKLLGMKTIAEFVENKEILEILTEIGVDYAQGYGMGKPVEFQREAMFGDG